MSLMQSTADQLVNESESISLSMNQMNQCDREGLRTVTVTLLAADRSVSQSVSHETMFVTPFWVSVHNVCTAASSPSCQSFISSDGSLSDDTPGILGNRKCRPLRSLQSLSGRHCQARFQSSL